MVEKAVEAGLLAVEQLVRADLEPGEAAMVRAFSGSAAAAATALAFPGWEVGQPIQLKGSPASEVGLLAASLAVSSASAAGRSVVEIQVMGVEDSAAGLPAASLAVSSAAAGRSAVEIRLGSPVAREAAETGAAAQVAVESTGREQVTEVATAAYGGLINC